MDMAARRDPRDVLSEICLENLSKMELEEVGNRYLVAEEVKGQK